MQLWTNGNGAGSEKQDVFWDMAHAAKDAHQFHKWARYPDLHSENKGDAKPEGFNGFYAQKEHRPSHHNFL